MKRRAYLAALIRLYLQPPGAPALASRHDWATAQALYAQGVPLHELLHAIRLATLRRLQRTGPPLPPICSLAYYRHVLQRLSPEEREPGYVLYVAERYRNLVNQSARSNRQNRALSDRQ